MLYKVLFTIKIAHVVGGEDEKDAVNKFSEILDKELMPHIKYHIQEMRAEKYNKDEE